MTRSGLVPSAAGATPAMAQWFAAKAEHPDALLFFRMGDFYEMFFDDAEAAAAALDIALTRRGEHNGAPISMCGVPVHAAEAYLARLIRRGFRVAIAEQMEDPKLRVGKAPIRREVVRLITPGTLTEESLLDSARPNLLLALVSGSNVVGAAWLDVSTGMFETQSVLPGDVAAVLGRLDPAEILASETLDLGDWSAKRTNDRAAPPPLVARRLLAEAFEVASDEAFGSFTDAEAMAAAQALAYVRATQAGKLPHLSRPLPRGSTGGHGMAGPRIPCSPPCSAPPRRPAPGCSARSCRRPSSMRRRSCGARMAGHGCAPTPPRRHGCARRCAARRTWRARWHDCRWGEAARATSPPSVVASPRQPPPPPPSMDRCPSCSPSLAAICEHAPSFARPWPRLLPTPPRCASTTARSPPAMTANSTPSAACATTAAG
jgi:hypothetical protein